MVKGDFGVKFVEPGQIPNKINNNRTLLVLVAPFKDDSFTLKAYTSIKDAIKEQKTTLPEAVGYRYLELLNGFSHVNEIVLMNVTTKNETTNQMNYEMTDEKLGDILAILEDTRYNGLIFTHSFNETQKEMYRVFAQIKKSKMEGCRAFTFEEPNEDGSNIPTFTNTFADGGIYMHITTPLPLATGGTLSLAESTVWLAGFVMGIPENGKHSMKVLEGVTGPVTKEVYNEDVYQACIMNGAIATKYIDRVNEVVVIANANTPDDNDLKIARTHDFIMNVLREAFEKETGETNTEEITYGEFQGTCIKVREDYKGTHITDLRWKVDKSGSASVDIGITENQDNVLQTINVFYKVIINE